MLRFPAFLGRFRRLLAPPGRPAEAIGVPAAGDDLEGELEPLLDQLDDVTAEATRIRALAREQADRIRADGLREAAAILEAARERADAERARAASRRRTQARRDAGETRAQATREVERIETRRAERVEELLAEVLACVRRGGP